MELRRRPLAAMECSMLSIERMVMRERAVCKTARDRTLPAVFCYSCAWVSQGNLAPRGRGGGQRAVRPTTPRSFSVGAWADGRERGAGGGCAVSPWYRRVIKFVLIG